MKYPLQTLVKAHNLI